MTELDFESDPKLQLLTDALRAGPGTPQWRQALAAVEHSPGADEFKLLYAARERLASGRAYRQVRAGPGFARKVFEQIDEHDAARGPRLPGVPAASNLIAAASALVILLVLAIVVYFVMPAGSRPLGGGEELSQVYFVNPITANTFDSEVGMEWGMFGSLPVQARDGLRPLLDNRAPDFRGGGVIWQQTIPPEQPFALEARVKLPKSTDDLAVQLFVTDDANFTGDSATSPHEMVWLARGGEASVVLPNGRVDGQSVKLKDRATADVRIAVARDRAAVDLNGKRLWDGPHQLDESKPRMLGIRFLARAGSNDEKDRPLVSSLRVLVPQKH
jgi:hypothetical protein